MTILLHPWSRAEQWRVAFEMELPTMPIQVWPDVHDPEAVRYAVLGLHDADDLRRYPNLQAILAVSAGIEHFRSPDFPDVPVVRLIDDFMSNEMAAYALHWVIQFQKHFDGYREQQARSAWEPIDYTPANEYRVGILGFGTIGRRIGETFTALDYAVNGWSRSPHEIEGVSHYAGAESLESFLAASNAVVNVLPSTGDTRQLMNADRFAQMPRGAVYISIGRGTTTDSDALLNALDTRHLHAAVLDVTRPEPLPVDSPLWLHPRAHITPHVAGFTLVKSASRLIADNIRRMEAGEAAFPLYDRSRGY